MGYDDSRMVCLGKLINYGDGSPQLQVTENKGKNMKPKRAKSYTDALIDLRSMMHHIDYFRPEEFDRVLPEDVSVMIPVIEFADEVRREFGKPLTVISHFRPPEWNQNSGQSPTSQHLWARAIDLKPRDPNDVYLLHVAALKVAGWIAPSGWYTGVGKYKTFVHVDISKPDMGGGRTRNSRW